MHLRSYILLIALSACAVPAFAEYNAPDLTKRSPAEPRYGIAAMVGRSAPAIASPVEKAVEAAPVNRKPLETPVQRIVRETKAASTDGTTFKPVGNRAFVDVHNT